VGDQRTLRLIKERFSGREDAVERLFDTSETFRSLCRDYLACSAVLAWWERSDCEGARRRALECSRMRTKLREDILRWLKGEQGTPGPSWRFGGPPWGD
jgi:hypothetical protein